MAVQGSARMNTGYVMNNENENSNNNNGNSNYDVTQCYHQVIRSIMEGRDAFYVRGLMERWFVFLHQASGARGTVASFCEIMKRGLVNGGGYEFLDDKGNTPLFWAAYYGRSDILAMLINEYKFSVNRQNFNGDSPLHFAIKGDSFECLVRLVDYGANMDVSNLQSEYPLHMATCAGLNYTQFLLERGADPECEDECGDTPLHWAVREDNFGCVDLLLRHGADPHHLNEDDESPLVFAELFGTKHKLLGSGAESRYNTGSSPMDVDDPVPQFPIYSFSADLGNNNTNYPPKHTIFYNEYH